MQQILFSFVASKVIPAQNNCLSFRLKFVGSFNLRQK